MTFAERNPRLKRMLADATDRGREGLARLFFDIEEVDDTTRRTAGAFLSAIISGVYTQWTVDPEGAPSGKDFTRGLQRIAALIQPGR